MQILFEKYLVVQYLWAFILTDTYLPNRCLAKPRSPNETVTHASVWTMLTCKRMFNLIKLYHLVIKNNCWTTDSHIDYGAQLHEYNQQQQNHRQRTDSSGNYWWLKCFKWHQIFALGSAVSFKTQKC